jgi:hypothetical protein
VFIFFCLVVVIAACIDRWALCSQSATIRSFSRPRIAICVILILIIIWAIIPIHLAVWYSNNTGQCIVLPDTYAFLYTIYSMIVLYMYMYGVNFFSVCLFVC